MRMKKIMICKRIFQMLVAQKIYHLLKALELKIGDQIMSHIKVLLSKMKQEFLKILILCIKVKYVRTIQLKLLRMPYNTLKTIFFNLVYL